MLIKKIRLKNFLLYINQELNLQKGVNIVAAENNSGKSAIFSAIKWCFKGNEIVKDGSTIKKNDAFNNISKKNNENELSVTIEFDHEDSNYLLIRKSIIKSGSHIETLQDSDFEEDTVHLQINNKPVSKNQVEDEIEKVLPDYAIKTLLFDGENLKDISKSILNIEGQEQKLLNLLKETIGIPYYEKIYSICKEKISELKKQKLNKLKSLNVATNTVEKLRTIVNEIEVKQENKKEFQKSLSEYNTRLKQTNKDMDKVFDDGKKLTEKQTYASIQKEHIEKNDRLVKENKKLISSDNFWESFLSNFLKKNYDESKQSKQQLEGKLNFLKKIEREISEKCKGEIQNLMNDVNEQIKNCEEDVFTISDWEDSQIIDLYKENVKNIKKEYLEINKYADKIEKLAEELRGFDQHNFSQLQETKAKLEIVIDKTKENIEKTEKDIELKQIDEKKLEKSLADNNEAKKIAEEIDFKIKLTQDLYDLFEDSRYQHLESIKNDIQVNSAAIYRLITREDSYKTGGLILNDDWSVSILDNENNKIKLNLVSSGTKECVALSIYAGLFQAIGKNRAFIGDSIFGRLDYVHKTNILNQADKFGSQLILFLTSSEHADIGLMKNSLKWNTLRINKKPSGEAEFAKADLNEMDEERIRTIKGDDINVNG